MEPWRQYVPDSALTMWNRPCEALFCYLSSQYPDHLLELVEAKCLEPQNQTYALESLSKIGTSERVRSALLDGIRSPHAVVREGALLGLLPHVREDDLLIFERVICEDVSAAVRDTAIDVLLSFQDSISNRDV